MSAQAEVTTLSPERAALRARHVGASEVAALFGAHPHLTLFELWHLKAGNIAPADLSENDRVKAGIFLEDGIGAWVAHETGWPVEKVKRYFQSPRVAGMGASPDFETNLRTTDEKTGLRGRVSVQVKNVDRDVFRDWQGQPPLHYQLQVQHEIACGGYDCGALAALVGGNSLKVFPFQRHDATIARLEAGVADFWRTVHEGIAPVPDFARDLDALKSLYSAANLGEVLDLSGDEAFADAARRYVEASAAAKAAEEAKKAAQAEIYARIQNAAVAVGDGFKVSTWNVEAAEVSFTRAASRGFRCSEVKGKTK